MRCRYRVTVYFPENWDMNEISELVLELANYFGLGCVREKAYKPRRGRGKIRIYMNSKLWAEGRSLREVRARFWGNWRTAKRMGVRV